MEGNIDLASFLERIDHLRIDNKIRSIRELARSAGVIEGTLANLWKPNRKTFPYADDAVQIAKVLGTTVEYLVRGEGIRQVENNPDMDQVCEMLKKLSHDELVEMRGVIRNHIDVHFKGEAPARSVG